ncbi:MULTISPECIES: hypothetical protein [unclassified Rhodococcus (in: high G+C Gram-positive bacteria)]|jgi:hypothetical protein|uniref:hypothetical protein n=1 Tax=unclassified Rhodococcus (in: high G+C Gram-positive bacteria) TaxID=192944 RepID=UPI00146B69E8|nr:MULTISPECIES: hypothetical protein [unclassified Rhodococcus (in: high G+C Gram-positive bacteria)]MBF0660492.1 hypothetical protein [Rhodococcus sp. (in: high G+C Gram-positive bacteria)]NMD93909.1 hypothetical protein [Rhodococcus sp. BL-253-APC-6A1W]
MHHHRRIVCTVAFVTTAYLIVFSLWLNLFLPKSEPGTVGFQIMFLVCLYGTVLGLAMVFSDRSSKVQRRIEREGFEGWATVRSAKPVRVTRGGQLTELDLDLTVPGSEPYHGKVFYEVSHKHLPRYTPGQIVTIFVDPEDRDRILLFP